MLAVRPICYARAGMRESKRNNLTVLLLLASLLMRAGIPDGYMPSAGDSGLLFELCPAGVPETFMRALSGSEHHQHHAAAESSEPHYDAGQCPIGHILSSSVAFDDLWQIESAPAAQEYIDTSVPAYRFQSVIGHRSRGPPA
jgi:hypothetical protein